MKTISIIIPCFNEAQNVARFYKTIMGEKWREMVSDYEMIFIDDGSTDGTIDEVKTLQKSDKNIRLIKFSRNFGKEGAILAGLKGAKNELITLMDCDLQDPPNLLSKMIEIYNANVTSNGVGRVKMIVAKRANRSGDGKIRAFFSEIFYKVNNALSSVKIVSGVRDFRLMEREVVQSILAMNEYHRFSKAIFEFVGFEKQYLEYEYVAREGGESKWSFLKLLRYGLGGIVSFSITPLRAITIIGIVIFALSGAWGSYILIKALIFGDPVKGYPSLMVLISFFGGLQIIMLGIIGEYIGRIYEQGKGRPHYIVEYES
ncbi:glycosyltransferase family 2 protein [Helicobacter sp. 23-1045]